MNVLIADKFENAGVDGLRALHCEVSYQPEAGAKSLAQAVAAASPRVLVVRSSKVKADAIAACKGVEVIIRAGAGVDNIDVPAATAAGIKVCNCPGMNAVAVAELTMGLLLSCDRRIPDQTMDLRAGQWNKKLYSQARGLKGMTLGVVGVGAIGQEVIKRAVAFGMNVVVWSRSITPQHASALSCEFGGTDTPALLALAARCDAVSVHLPYVDSTKRLFNAGFFAMMKPGAYFINTSRGGVVDETALAEAIRTKGLRAGLDVYDTQPAETQAPFQNALFQLPGVYGTHHVGASTDQAQGAIAAEVVRMVRVLKESGRVENCVNA